MSRDRVISRRCYYVDSRLPMYMYCIRLTASVLLTRKFAGDVELKMKRGSRTSIAKITPSFSNPSERLQSLSATQSVDPVTLAPQEAYIVQQLTQMGFKAQESMRAVRIYGSNIDEAMVWIVEQREESQFESELAQASVMSEDGKKQEIARRGKREAEDAAVKPLCSLFPGSIFLNADGNTNDALLRGHAINAEHISVEEAAAALKLGQPMSEPTFSEKPPIRPVFLRLLTLGMCVCV